jgi:hypothetical protein
LYYVVMGYTIPLMRTVRDVGYRRRYRDPIR